MIDFTKVFPQDTLNQKLNVLKYYVKNISCRLASTGFSISDRLLDFLNGGDTLNHIYIKHEIRLDILWFIERIKKNMPDPGNLYIGPLRYIQNNNRKDIDVVYSYYNYKWFRTMYFYSERVTDNTYPGYDQYNKLLQIPIESLYTIEKAHFETLNDEDFEKSSKERNSYSDNDLLNDNLGINPFACWA